MIDKPIYGDYIHSEDVNPQQYQNIGIDGNDIVVMDTKGGHYVVNLDDGSLTCHPSFSR